MLDRAGFWVDPGRCIGALSRGSCIGSHRGRAPSLLEMTVRIHKKRTITPELMLLAVDADPVVRVTSEDIVSIAVF